ncbi:hypothetical protein [Limosilactobacillus albertensis]|uniref:Uncharacterized protein n=1 Tax=Limosilactobacillus albertensis TaxID=2759752 RepID=A0A839HBS4_9LACO|nr:hypothetical protein [Limosilactobacillus albertensis]MBB1124409.1 hypothetical protein [Limosilactobacillus albertensis]MCD7121652.1 hypothetical protein [Limosilactobacillus albertensis]
MSTCITKELSNALNSLTENNEWGNSSQSIDKMLQPKDWRMVEIKKFRKRLKEQEKKGDLEAIKSINEFFNTHNINDKIARAVLLRICGVDVRTICKIIKLSVSAYTSHVTPLLRNHKSIFTDSSLKNTAYVLWHCNLDVLLEKGELSFE